MINDFKLGLRLIKYGLNMKGCLVISIIFMIWGILMDFALPESPINGMFVGMGGMMIVQLICSVSVSTMVQSSNYKRVLQTSVPTIVCGGYLLLGNTISIIMKFAGLKLLDGDLAVVSNGIIFTAVLMVIMVLYMGGATKAFWPATVCFFIVYLAFYFLSSALNIMMSDQPLYIPIEVSVILSYVMLIVAILLMYFLFVAMYKRDFSKQNFETQLKRAK